MSIPDAQAKLNAMFKEIHIYQAQNKDYRACLQAAMDADQAKAPTMKDGSDKRATEDEYTRYAKSFNDSVDSEKDVAQQANAAATAHCARDNSDFCHPKH